MSGARLWLLTIPKAVHIYNVSKQLWADSRKGIGKANSPATDIYGCSVSVVHL